MKEPLFCLLAMLILVGAAFGWTASMNAYVFSGPTGNPCENSSLPLENTKVIFSFSQQKSNGNIVEEGTPSDLTDHNGIASFNKEIKNKEVGRVVYSVLVKNADKIISSKDFVIEKPNMGNFAAGFILVGLGSAGSTTTTSTTTTTIAPPPTEGILPDMTVVGATLEVKPGALMIGTPESSLTSTTTTTTGMTTTTMPMLIP